MDSTANNPIDLYDLNYQQLTQLLADWGYSTYHAGQLWQQLYRQRVSHLSQLGSLRPDLQARLASHTRLGRLAVLAEQQSQDGTRKFLLGLPDGQGIETVIMPYRERFTACISTQAGCAMGCVFCATGQMGFVRHLHPGEIVAQVLHVLHVLASSRHPHPLRNIVLMGMGEPLHNYDATMTALDILTDDRGLAIASRHITISTVGLVPAIRRLADEARPGHLAVSLHAATDEERNKLVPLGRRWPLAELIDACRYYVAQRGRRIFFEWTLIAGHNDTPTQAHALGRLLHGLDAHVNLIPLNPTANFPGRGSTPADIRQFKAILAQYNLPSTVRQRKGLDIDAGCGQLRKRSRQPAELD